MTRGRDANHAYVMPAGLGGGLPISSVNAETADVVIYRIGDRSMAAALRNGIFQRTLDGYSAEDVADSYGEKLWEGQLDLAQGAANEMTVTTVPVSDVGGFDPSYRYAVDWECWLRIARRTDSFRSSGTSSGARSS